MIIFISGLPGSGKSTIGKIVAERLGWRFIEADDFLTASMKDQIREGIFLSPDQLHMWIMETVIPSIVDIEKEHPIVVAGLLAEQKFVEKLYEKSAHILYVNLDAPYEILRERVLSRNHFAQQEMLDMGWKMKERLLLPGPRVDATRSIETVAQDIIKLIPIFD